MDNQKDEQLWRLAKKRASFKKNIFSYFVVNAFLWAIWWLTQGRYTGITGIPWPVWPMLGWGLGLAFHYFEAYGEGSDKAIEREYQRLKKEKEQ